MSETVASLKAALENANHECVRSEQARQRLREALKEQQTEAEESARTAQLLLEEGRQAAAAATAQASAATARCAELESELGVALDLSTALELSAADVSQAAAFQQPEGELPQEMQQEMLARLRGISSSLEAAQAQRSAEAAARLEEEAGIAARGAGLAGVHESALRARLSRLQVAFACIL